MLAGRAGISSEALMAKALIIGAKELALLDDVSHTAFALYARTAWQAGEGVKLDSDGLRVNLLDNNSKPISNAVLRSAMRELIAAGLVVLDRPRDLASVQFPLRTKR